ncbi:MAG TPA: hypothetical protein VIV60_14925, partial [Polyangiaceae bacterium]
LYIYFAMFLLFVAGFALAISLGIKADDSTSKLGVLGAAWVATKLTQPLRIIASMALTPLFARWFKLRKKDPAASAED